MQTVLPYRRIMTPCYIQKHATISGSYLRTPQYFEICSTTYEAGALDFQRVLKIQLIAPGILTGTDCISATVIAAFDSALAANDHDPWIGITDGVYFNGFVVSDPAHTEAYDGICGNILFNRASAGQSMKAPQYPAEIKMQFKPSENWGSAYDDNYVAIGNYNNTLNLTNGLFLELYRDEVKEKYHIRYITVDVYLE